MEAELSVCWKYEFESTTVVEPTAKPLFSLNVILVPLKIKSEVNRYSIYILVNACNSLLETR